MPPAPMTDTDQVRSDFDAIARLSDLHDSGTDRYDGFLLSLIPGDSRSVLDIGCGLGRLTHRLAAGERTVTGIDLSPEMIARARRQCTGAERVTLRCGDFLRLDFGDARFDCILSAATLHHLPEARAVGTMVRLLRPGGRLIIHDLRRTAGVVDQLQALVAACDEAARRLLRTGRLRPARAVRAAWARHGAAERYRTPGEARALAARFSPAARYYHHWLWRYTLVWDRPGAV